MMSDAEWLDHWLQRAPALSGEILERLMEHLTEGEDE
jgi:hypothetical protein